MTSSASASNRFGLGAKPGEIAQRDGRAQVLQQVQSRGSDAREFASLPGSATYLQREYAFKFARRMQKNDGAVAGADAAPKSGRNRWRRLAAVAGTQGDAQDGDFRGQRQALRQMQMAEVQARYRNLLHTGTPFVERLVRFWSNHFAISIDKGPARLYALPMEREAIRPNVLGNFADLLLAVETHPGMLRYLDNANSIGADSRAAQRRERMQGRQAGLNENLAREILELHTLGADSGYTQADVTEFARAITGWSVPGAMEMARGDASSFVFRPNTHEPGTRTVLGKRYADDGEGQGRAILLDLARNPATATHLSTKLARHFVSDTPPPALVARMRGAYLSSGGNLAAMARAMVESAEAWTPDARKLKTPDDFLVSAMRAGGIDLADRPQQLMGLLSRMGQPLFTPRSPAGFPDTTADWGGADALWKRIQAAEGLASRVGADAAAPYDLARAVVGDAAVQGDFASALRRAGSPRDGYALLFASPAFQWRT